jgi:hypothetical protein
MVSIRKGRSLSWAEREEMVLEYSSGKWSKQEIWKKYTGQDKEHGQMLVWMRKLGYISESKPSQVPKSKHTKVIDNRGQEQSSADLLKRIKELEQQLQRAQLKAEGYELMIEIAEKELKIPIRKK